ncbi:MAG TPA: PspA/IM30 family protein [Ktedonobacteraceae bacterium]|nr:PspA/IM30 family protein [Ktedonobacteraceae bacterium]
MNLLERVLTLLRANLNAVVEKSDDPEKTLRQLQLDMRNQLVQVKTQVATAISESRKLQSRAAAKQAEADVWYKKAENAVQHNNESAARDALIRHNDIIKLSNRYQQQQQEQDQLITTMRTVLRQLESKIAEVEATIELLVTRKRNALLQQRVYDALSKTGGSVDKEKASRAQDAVMEAEARARAMADLHKRDLDFQLDQLSEEQVIDQQLDQLRAKQRSAGEPPLLQEGKAHLSPLLDPQPQNNEPSKKRASARKEAAAPQREPSPSGQLDLEELRRLMEK